MLQNEYTFICASWNSGQSLRHQAGECYERREPPGSLPAGAGYEAENKFLECDGPVVRKICTDVSVEFPLFHLRGVLVSRMWKGGANVGYKEYSDHGPNSWNSDKEKGLSLYGYGYVPTFR
jgi:hypothetical protein